MRERQLKNAYIGEYHDFQNITDFRNYSSLAELQEVGWGGTFIQNSASISYGSNGLAISGNGYGGLYLQLPNAITANDKITMKFTGVAGGNGGYNAGAGYLTLSTSTKPNLLTNNQTEFGAGEMFGNRDGGVNNIGCSKIVNGTKTWGVWGLSGTKTGTSGAFSAECVLDLPNKYATFTIKSPSSTAEVISGAISDAGLQLIVGTQYLIVWVSKWENNTHYIYTSEITIN